MSNMNGAESLVRTLVASKVEVCFTNPGTSEMHFVAALDKVDGMRAILGLFEGAVTGMADGYGRMAEKPACTLLHLGPGLANGLANLHNARRAQTPIVNIVGDHATYHAQYDAPLASDIKGFASPVSGWIHSSPSPKTVAADGARAVQASMAAPGQIATLILPADTAWLDADGPADALAINGPSPVSQAAVDATAKALKSGKKAAIMIRGKALQKRGLIAAGRIAAATGARIMCDTFAPRVERGAGIVMVERIPYFAEQIVETFAEVEELILVCTKPPVSFFAYPGKPSWCTLVDTLPTGKLNQFNAGEIIARFLPEGAIIADEAATSGMGSAIATATAAPHDHMSLTGGAIGMGLPVATGAAVACPDRKVVCLHGDGGAMYTLQSLWTQAREKLDVVNIIFANNSYAILNIELMRVGAENPGPKALSMLDLHNPELNWVQLGSGMGVESVRVTTCEEFADAYQSALKAKGPRLIEVMI